MKRFLNLHNYVSFEQSNFNFAKETKPRVNWRAALSETNVKAGVNLLLNFSNVEIQKKFLSTSKRVFPSYQGKSTIFDKVNFLSQTPDTKNTKGLRDLFFPHPLSSRTKRSTQRQIIQ